ncbi:hypothetical protein, partial [Acinetobacter baumannii]|uniref:hypothetical protein n=1 Tax=Acinetobacter baumannii TaxID=470 RepID=UPI000ADEFCDB
MEGNKFSEHVADRNKEAAETEAAEQERGRHHVSELAANKAADVSEAKEEGNAKPAWKSGVDAQKPVWRVLFLFLIPLMLSNGL